MLFATILLFMIFVIAVTILIAAIMGGISFIVAFGDVIVFGLIIFLIVRALNKK